MRLLPKRLHSYKCLYHWHEHTSLKWRGLHEFQCSSDLQLKWDWMSHVKLHRGCSSLSTELLICSVSRVLVRGGCPGYKQLESKWKSVSEKSICSSGSARPSADPHPLMSFTQVLVHPGHRRLGVFSVATGRLQLSFELHNINHCCFHCMLITPTKKPSNGNVHTEESHFSAPARPLGGSKRMPAPLSQVEINQSCLMGYIWGQTIWREHQCQQPLFLISKKPLSHSLLVPVWAELLQVCRPAWWSWRGETRSGLSPPFFTLWLSVVGLFPSQKWIMQQLSLSIPMPSAEAVMCILVSCWTVLAVKFC